MSAETMQAILPILVGQQDWDLATNIAMTLTENEIPYNVWAEFDDDANLLADIRLRMLDYVKELQLILESGYDNIGSWFLGQGEVGKQLLILVCSGETWGDAPPGYEAFVALYECEPLRLALQIPNFLGMSIAVKDMPKPEYRPLEGGDEPEIDTII